MSFYLLCDEFWPNQCCGNFFVVAKLQPHIWLYQWGIDDFCERLSINVRKRLRTQFNVPLKYFIFAYSMLILTWFDISIRRSSANELQWFLSIMFNEWCLSTASQQVFLASKGERRGSKFSIRCTISIMTSTFHWWCLNGNIWRRFEMFCV